ncbi:phospholipase A2 inhibitor and Ly6/PLAUR domain-containing protein isoform X1 [Anolis carolinensis]|uniref:phospholipase A2 inhibitor and Ly6/PLAUR domain-containing protein isoform X1 n=2 Tax=Anolis carolinensis TaxID=28377 RepID=UPI002F2B8CEE
MFNLLFNINIITDSSNLDSPRTFPITMKTFLVFLLNVAVLRNGNSLDCETCQRDGIRCSGRFKTCKDDNDICIKALLENTDEGRRRLRTEMACANSRVCQMPLQYLNTGQGRYERTSIVCCRGNACRNAVPRFQPGFIKPNGRQCPACLASNRTECGSAKVSCSGDELYCIEAQQYIRLGFRPVPRYKRGCATGALCKVDGGTYRTEVGIKYPNPICSLARPID